MAGEIRSELAMRELIFKFTLSFLCSLLFNIHVSFMTKFIDSGFLSQMSVNVICNYSHTFFKTNAVKTVFSDFLEEINLSSCQIIHVLIHNIFNGSIFFIDLLQDCFLEVEISEKALKLVVEPLDIIDTLLIIAAGMTSAKHAEYGVQIYLTNSC